MRVFCVAIPYNHIRRFFKSIRKQKEGKQMKTKINHFDSLCVVFIITIISLTVWIHLVQAVPPGKSYKERKAMAESGKDIKVGMSYAEIQAKTFTDHHRRT